MATNRHVGILGLLCLGLLAGCAGSTGVGSGPSSSALRPTRLTVELLPGFIAYAKTVRYSVSCQPPSGTLPDAGAACRRLLADPAILSVRSRCFLPDTGSNVVTGQIDGRAVQVRLGNCDPDSKAWARIARALGLSAPPA
jgi:hypothetical protein